MLGGEEKQLDFQTQIPVHITYQTAFVDDAGKLQFREDIYGLDRKLMSILGGSERQVADVAFERPADPNFKPTPSRARSSQRRGAAAPFKLFEQFSAKIGGNHRLEMGRISAIRPPRTLCPWIPGHFSPYSR